jgi:hypothetical protein
MEVAWRITHLMHMGRSCPDLDAELFFDTDEIQGAHLLSDVRRPARPKLNEVLRLIARLGGSLGRKGDGEAGVKAIWLGLKEVHVADSTSRKLRG